MGYSPQGHKESDTTERTKQPFSYPSLTPSSSDLYLAKSALLTWSSLLTFPWPRLFLKNEISTPDLYDTGNWCLEYTEEERLHKTL